MAQSATKGWDNAMARKDWQTLNEVLTKDANNAAAELKKAWGGGGSQGIKFAKKYEEWFYDFHMRITDVQIEGKLKPTTENAILSGCAAVLAVKAPKWEWIEDIRNIRYALVPGRTFQDYGAPAPAPMGQGDDSDDEPI